MQRNGWGCFVFSWRQVEIDGATGSPPATMPVGANWRWQGDALRVDHFADILQLGRGEDIAALHQRANTRVRRLLSGEMPRHPVLPAGHEDEAPANSFEVTDGLRTYCGTILDEPDGPPLVMFEADLPPPDTDLWVTRQDVARGVECGRGGLVCFTPGTLISTAQGPKKVEEIGPGDKLQTRDNGLQDVVWRGRKHLTGGRLMAMPRLRPVRFLPDSVGPWAPDAPLWLSPDHQINVAGAVAETLFGEEQVFVAAQHLIGLPGIERENRIANVDYIHLMLPAHEVIFANGLECESFHPASADLSVLGRDDQHLLERLFPGVVANPGRFGQFARRVLSRAEAALLLHGLRLGH